MPYTKKFTLEFRIPVRWCLQISQKLHIWVPILKKLYPAPHKYSVRGVCLMSHKINPSKCGNGLFRVIWWRMGHLFMSILVLVVRDYPSPIFFNLRLLPVSLVQNHEILDLGNFSTTEVPECSDLCESSKSSTNRFS